MLLTFLEYFPGILFSIIMGLGFGGYSTMGAYRLPRGERWIGVKPRCLHCNHVLVLKDFFPIFSYLWNKNQCKYCGGLIECQPVYLYVEVATVVFCVTSFLAFGFNEIYLLVMALGVLAALITAMDMDKHFVSGKLVIVLFVTGILYRGIDDPSIYNIIAGVTLMLVISMLIRHAYFYLKGDLETAFDYTRYDDRDKFSGAGFQYVKLATACGAWTGLTGLPIFIFIGLILLLVLWLIRKLGYIQQIPYSVPLLTALMMVVYG